MKLRWSHRAEQDLLEIGRYIAEDNRPAARRWVERLRQRARQAAEHPQAGRMVPEHSRPDIREVLLHSYRIVYVVGADAIQVVAVFEGHRLFPRRVVPELPDTED
ncbi:MAG: type II toxin-antitoxin system RelE/ParE family toxin [Deltaproteobacteria bacterium]|nr:type II toxin-antitoxin system RelE/ParE family toxin [Deltaproteobacteria bacterium]